MQLLGTGAGGDTTAIPPEAGPLRQAGEELMEHAFLKQSTARRLSFTLVFQLRVLSVKGKTNSKVKVLLLYRRAASRKALRDWFEQRGSRPALFKSCFL